MKEELETNLKNSMTLYREAIIGEGLTEEQFIENISRKISSKHLSEGEESSFFALYMCEAIAGSVIESNALDNFLEGRLASEDSKKIVWSIGGIHAKLYSNSDLDELDKLDTKKLGIIRSKQVVRIWPEHVVESYINYFLTNLKKEKECTEQEIDWEIQLIELKKSANELSKISDEDINKRAYQTLKILVKALNISPTETLLLTNMIAFKGFIDKKALYELSKNFLFNKRRDYASKDQAFIENTISFALEGNLSNYINKVSDKNRINAMKKLPFGSKAERVKIELNRRIRRWFSNLPPNIPYS